MYVFTVKSSETVPLIASGLGTVARGRLGTDFGVRNLLLTSRKGTNFVGRERKLCGKGHGFGLLVNNNIRVFWGLRHQNLSF